MLNRLTSLNPLRKKKMTIPKDVYADIFKTLLNIPRGSPSLLKVLVARKKPVVENSPVKNKKSETRKIKI